MSDVEPVARSLVSVIVRTKDRPQLLSEALASIAAQTYRPVEIVVVNDGGCPVDELAAEACRQLPYRVVTHLEARGRAAAANAGLAVAQGDWIAFLDDDDVLLPEGLATLVAAADGEEVVAYGRVDAYRHEAGRPPALYRSFAHPFDLDALLFENFIPINACLIPVSALRVLGGMDESLECFEDWDLFLRLADRLPFRSVDRPVAEYRIFDDAFIVGRGGTERQRTGQLAILRKHRERYGPEALNEVLHRLKAKVIPAERRAAEATLGARAGRAEAERDALARRVAELEGTLVSVIIASYNSRRHLERCLPALLATSGVPFEVIVVDNASSDGSAAWLAERWPQVRLLVLPRNAGFGAANRHGTQAAHGQYLAFLNSDTVVEPGWLVALLRPLQAHPEIAAACSTLALLDRPELLNAAGGGMTWLGFGFDHGFMLPREHAAPGPGEAREVLFPTAAAMLMGRRDFFELGGFDPAMFMYHEDVDLGWRLWLLGRRVVVAGDSIVQHAFGGTSRAEKGLAWRERLGARHDVRSLIKHYEPYNLARALKNLAKVWWRQRRRGLIAYVTWWNLAHLPGTLRERRRVQRHRARSDRELFDSGLISDAPVPPPTPEPPRWDATLDPAVLPVSPMLLPASVSGISRLGHGWFAPEPLGAGSLARWTGGDARCVLRVAPGEEGRLQFHVRLPTAAGGERAVTVSCGPTRATFPLTGEGWETLSMPVRADKRGILDVRIVSSTFVPHRTRYDWDFRRLGCAVAEIRFRPASARGPTRFHLVSVVIPTYNRWPILAETLAALGRQTHRNLEVIVVDDGSTDGTYDRLQSWRHDHPGPSLKIARQNNLKQGQARNHGLRVAEGDLVLFLGDDIVPDERLLEEHVAAHHATGEPCAVVGFVDWHREQVRVTPFLELVNREGQQFAFGLLEDGQDCPFTCFYTSNVSLPRSLLGENPFRPDFAAYGWEDVEFGYRLVQAGVRIVYRRSASARHLHAMSLRDFLRRQRLVGKTLGTLLRLHPELTVDPALAPPQVDAVGKLAAKLWSVAAPAACRLDRWGLRLSNDFYRGLLLGAFEAGRRDDRRETGPPT